MKLLGRSFILWNEVDVGRRGAQEGISVEVVGRVLVRFYVEEIKQEKIISTTIFNESVEIDFIKTAENIEVGFNKKLEVQADGKIVKII